MKKITDKEYIEFQKYKQDKENGRILTPDGLRFICSSCGYDPWKIGHDMLDALAKMDFKAF